MKNLIRKIKEKATAVAAKIQKALVAIFVFITYFIVLGLFYPMVALFYRKLFRPKSKEADSYWLEVTGYEPDMEDCLRQS